MMNDAVTLTGEEQALTLATDGFQFTPTGLVVDGQPTYDTWEMVGRKLQYIEGAVHWWIGDWLNYGERAYGEIHAQAIDDNCPYSYQTLRNDKYVASKVELSRRRDNLTFGHHAEVASLEPEQQEVFLDIAEADGLAIRELRDTVRSTKYLNRPKSNRSGPLPVLFHGRAEDLRFIDSETVDIIITSPPYNLGAEFWPMGGDGRESRTGIGYDDAMPEDVYQAWQRQVLDELYRVARPGASLFYNHKLRQKGGAVIHPVQWLSDSQWKLRQEVIWDRGSTHNHCPQLFWQHDERVYWLTKGNPILPDRPVGFPTIWELPGPVPNTWHPAPFSEEIPKRCLEAIGRDGVVVLDPFGGSMTTCRVAQKMGYSSIGVDANVEYVERAREDYGW